MMFIVPLFKYLRMSRFMQLFLLKLVSRLAYFLIALVLTPLFCQSEIVDISELKVIGRRYSMDQWENPFDDKFLERNFIETAPQRRLDDALRSIPGFSLFRRSSSRVAHPTTQGVSLRNLGPNGAGRTLVLLDGIPLNDPFGGWVYWNRLPVSSIEGVEMMRGGGAGPWGNAALGGVIHLFSRKPEKDFALIEASGGNRGTSDINLVAQKSSDDLDVFITVNRFSTDGYPVLRADQRGPIDRDAFSEAELVKGGFRWRLTDNNTLVFNASYFNEERGNGTPLAANDTEAYDASISLNGSSQSNDTSWQAQLYYQNRDFRNLFTSVNADRDSENPALEQFDVPAEAWGANAVINLKTVKGHQLIAGVDARKVEGATNERYFFTDTFFNRERNAGGEQTLFGFFLEDVWEVSPALNLVFGGRADYWSLENGRRKETNLVNGEILRDDQFPDRDEWVGNFRLGANYIFNDQLRARGALYTGFRAPTLNEFYRPFRVRVDITEANPLLERERLYGGEAGLEFQPNDDFVFRLTYFLNYLDDAIANVTLGFGPGPVDPCGFVPNGGTCRQRHNLGQVRVGGLELDASWEPNEKWRLSASYLYSDSEITESPVQFGLENNRLAQSPKHMMNLSLTWNPIPKWTNSLQLRYTSSQYENDLNTLELKDYTVLDFYVSYKFNKKIEGFVSIENFLDTEFETGKASNGLISIGAPIMATVGLRWRL